MFVALYYATIELQLQNGRHEPVNSFFDIRLGLKRHVYEQYMFEVRTSVSQ